MTTQEVPLRRYRIERYLAEGGMGAIYVGKKLGAGGFEKEVVLKQLLPEFTQRPEFRDLFFREAKISGSLDHTNIVRTYDLVRSDDALFIVMEYVRGADLRTICWRARLKRKPLSTAAIIHIALEILAGLSYAHGRADGHGKPLSIIHRDVSPSNILCSGQGDVKLSDFGIAKASSFVSVFYKVRGKVGYMSPEQARSQPLDARSDLFSLAVCIYEALTGERLFVGDLQTPPDQIYGQPIPSLLERRPDLPPTLDEVMRRALTSEPAGRYADAAAFAQALRQVARESGLTYSTRELAAELTEILGPDAENWMFDDGSSASQDTERIPIGKSLEGREAAAINVPETQSASPGLASPETPVLTSPGALYEPTPILTLAPPTLPTPPPPVAAAPAPVAVPPARPRRRLLVAGAVAVAVLVVAALFWADGKSRGPGGAPAAEGRTR